MSRSWQMRARDVLHAIEKIERYLDGSTFELFSANEEKVDAVIRNLEVIGEAMTRLEDDLPESLLLAHPDIPWQQIKGMRNILAHVYFGVSLPIIWDTATKELASLKERMISLLAHESP